MRTRQTPENCQAYIRLWVKMVHARTRERRYHWRRMLHKHADGCVKCQLMNSKGVVVVKYKHESASKRKNTHGN